MDYHGEGVSTTFMKGPGFTLAKSSSFNQIDRTFLRIFTWTSELALNIATHLRATR